MLSQKISLIHQKVFFNYKKVIGQKVPFSICFVLFSAIFMPDITMESEAITTVDLSYLQYFKKMIFIIVLIY